MKKVLFLLIVSCLVISCAKKEVPVEPAAENESVETVKTGELDFSKQNQINDFLSRGDYENAKVLLDEWEKEESDNPELLIGFFNYYLFRNAKDENIVGYMQNGTYGIYAKTFFDEDDLNTAISYLDKALLKNPKRMDIYFGKISSLLKAEKFEKGTEAINDFLKQYEENKTEWYWSNYSSFTENGWDIERTVIDSLNDYCKMYDYVEDRENSKEVIETILSYFPENLIFLNNLSVFYSYGKEYEKAVEVLLKAYSIDNSDYIIVANIARNYEDLGKSKEALKWYNTLANMDSDAAKEYAQKSIERLNK